MVREIWTLGKFGAFGPNFGQKMNLAHQESLKKRESQAAYLIDSYFSVI